MLAYVLNNENLKIKDILEFEEYEFREDIEYAEKSSITVARKPNIQDDDFVFCKNGNDMIFVGICETFDSSGSREEYQISLLQKENLFDRDIFVENEEMISGMGIEDFLVKAIQDNFIDSGDPIMDKSYIVTEALTHTPVAAKADAENGIYNLKKYLEEVKQYYGIFLDFDFSDNNLIVRIIKKEEPEIPIDISVTDISDYTEMYSVSALAKLLVNWKIPDIQNEQGDIIVGSINRRQFFLLADQTITENENDPNRAAGMVKSVYVEAQTEEEMLQQVDNEFSSNKYNHKISFSLKRGSKLYPEKRFYVGRKCTIRTKSGVRTSIITKLERKNSSAMIGLTFGNLKITLIEKLRRR